MPRLVVIHYTAMTDWVRARDWLCNPEAQVSAHYIISETGLVTQMVKDADRAWHAGAGGWQDTCDVNSWSIGIELANTGAHPFPEPQMAALECLLAELLRRHGIDPAGVIAHSDCAIGRKIDPGARFDWLRLARQGLAIAPKAPQPAQVDQDRFAALLTCIGYPDGQHEARLAAFRLRFRAGATGPLSAQDIGVAVDIADQVAKSRKHLA